MQPVLRLDEQQFLRKVEMDPVEAMVGISELRKARGRRPVPPSICNTAWLKVYQSYSVNIAKPQVGTLCSNSTVMTPAEIADPRR